MYERMLFEKLSFPSHTAISEKCKNLLLRLLNKNPNERMGNIGGIDEILSHSWFNDANIDKVNRKL